MGLSLGLDTSCYTTSVAVVDEQGKLLFEHRQLLKVPVGERGLQQSMAVFQHVQNLPVIIPRAFEHINSREVKVIAASVKPRPLPGSYLPVFVVGEALGRSLAAALRVPFRGVSHQEGHLVAGLWSAGAVPRGDFLAVHLSGGTSEILLVKLQGDSWAIQKLGGTKDLHAGQLVDRVGVRLGLPFPAGPHLEKLAWEGEGKIRLHSCVRGYDFSFSGPEAQALRFIEAGTEPAEVAWAVEQCIAKTLERVLRRAVEEYGLKDILIVGGVAANEHLRRRLVARLEHRAVGARLYFARPEHTTDNAIGVALLGLGWGTAQIRQEKSQY
ncbi:MAG: hypothetical protein PWP65_472 [Clostridia bacterium]|nr:hypothetical protein [Clostridia bacterium]